MHDDVQEPQIIKMNLVCVVVCVPEEYTDFEACEVACGGLAKELEQIEAKGILDKHGSSMRHLKDCANPTYHRPAKPHEMQGDPERIPCDERPGFVHICIIRGENFPPLRL